MTVCDVIENYFKEYNLSRDSLGYYILRETVMVCWWKGILYGDALVFIAGPNRERKISSLEWECEKTLKDAEIYETPKEFTSKVFSRISYSYEKEDELWQVKSR